MSRLRSSIVMVLSFVLGSGLAVPFASSREPVSRFPAVIRCASDAEDMFGRPRLVIFERKDDGSLRLVYRCREDDR